MFPDELFAGHLDEFGGLEDAETEIHLAHDASDGRFGGAGGTDEGHVQRGCFAVVLGEAALGHDLVVELDVLEFDDVGFDAV